LPSLNKRAIVIQDIITIATYISNDNLDAGDRFIYAAEATFQQIAKLPKIGKISGFSHPEITQVRQYPIKGFKNYLIFYRLQTDEIDVMRVLHGAQEIELILSPEISE
jgi:toxin ParE1/3/4